MNWQKSLLNKNNLTEPSRYVRNYFTKILIQTILIQE